MPRFRTLQALALALSISACDTPSPTGLEATLDEAAVAELAVSALEMGEREGAPLPSQSSLLRLTLQTIRAHPEAHVPGIDFLKRARVQARKAQEAREAGDTEEAREHAARSQALTLEAILAVLGPDVAIQAAAGVRQALQRMDQRLSGKALPDRQQAALDRARKFSVRSQMTLANGQHRASLGFALAAADLIRGLSPRYQARKAIERSTRVYMAAVDAVKADTTPEEADTLKKARRLLAAAKTALDAREFGKAFRKAVASAELSLGVLRARAGG